MFKEEIKITDLWALAKRNLGKILGCTIVGIVISAILTFFVITPKYSSQAQLLAQLPQENQPIGNGVNNNLMLINTYKDLVKSNLVIDDATEQLNKKYHYDLEEKEVNKAITVSQKENSQMFTIQAVSTDPVEAKNMANTVAEIFKKKAKKTMKVDSISITSRAVANDQPISPNKKLNLLLGAVIGFIISIIWIAISVLRDKTVKSEEWIVETLDIPILGMIPSMSEKDLNRSNNR